MARNDGGSAFPFEGGANNGLSPEGGMSLRDYFAGQALGGIIPVISVAGENSLLAIAKENGLDIPTTRSAVASSVAYGYADAMLAEREKGNG